MLGVVVAQGCVRPRAARSRFRATGVSSSARATTRLRADARDLRPGGKNPLARSSPKGAEVHLPRCEMPVDGARYSLESACCGLGGAGGVGRLSNKTTVDCARQNENID